jgi:hypothetical protein
MEHEHAKQSVTIAIRLESLEVRGVAIPFAARSEGVLLSRGQELGRIADLTPRGIAVFHFRNAGEHYLVEAGWSRGG